MTSLEEEEVLRSSQARSLNRNRTRAKKPLAQGMLGKIVNVPATDLGIEIPGMIYRARILTRDTRREDRVLVKFFEDDDSESWLPMGAAKKWLRTGGNGTDQCTNEETDLYGAECLMMLQRPPQNPILRFDGDENLQLEEHLSNSISHDEASFPTPHCVLQDNMSSAE
ncbi:hypothetical protein BSKO_03646 [Bryopsis sp. KO-2023]|nr:hypothetical protein BSKO_03646 [Bryopsis sp. KO-2023]